MYRDFFKCNPSNTGHYQYPKFETLAYDEGCHRKEVKRYIKRNDPEKYVVFYTRHTELSGNSKNRIIGYFKVGKVFNRKNKEGFVASEAVLLPKGKGFSIDYSGRGVPVSWGHSSIRKKVGKILNRLILINGSKNNKAKEYKRSTKNITNYLSNVSGRKKLISICEECEMKSECYWGRIKDKASRLQDLYGRDKICLKTC